MVMGATRRREPNRARWGGAAIVDDVRAAAAEPSVLRRVEIGAGGAAQVVMMRSMLSQRRTRVLVISPLKAILPAIAPILTKFVALAI